MSLWVDKYRPRELTKLDYHKEQANDLKRLCEQQDFPHLMFFGPNGSGKKTRIQCMLRELYGPGVDRLRNETMPFETPSNKKIEIMAVASNHHIELNPSDAGIYDRVVVSEIIKQIAQTANIDVSSDRDFKVIVLTEVDSLTKDAQHALRRTMEKYVATCRIMLCCNSTSRIIPAIKSRCLGIRVAAPSIEEIVQILQQTCRKENLTLPNELATNIAKASNRNLRTAILMLEAAKVQKYPFTNNQQVPAIDWKVFLNDTANLIVRDTKVESIERIRENFYQLLSQGVAADVIFSELIKLLTTKCDVEVKSQIFEYASYYEHQMLSGSKPIYHLEAFVAKFMCVYREYLLQITEMMDED